MDFRKEIIGRTVTGVGRYGKLFYIELDGTGRMPVLHLGMTGMIQVKGQEPTWYRRRHKDLSADVWPPPKFLKFIIHFAATDTEPANELAFLDARRLGRIRLVQSPRTEAPISELGFDPILSMPAFEEFKPLVLKRSCPIKALLLDQSFSAGVGNWVADEILYQARVHPEQRANNLSGGQLKAIYEQTKSVCETAVSVNADSTQFPSHWLFNYRWGKGQKNNADMTLPDGQTAQIKWLTVGGRTSAIVEQLQKVPEGGRERNKKGAHVEQSDDEDSDEDEEADDDYGQAGPSKPTPTQAGKRKASGTSRKADDAAAEDGNSSDLTPAEDSGPIKKIKTAVEVTTVRRSTRGETQIGETTSVKGKVVETAKAKTTTGRAKKASTKK